MALRRVSPRRYSLTLERQQIDITVVRVACKDDAPSVVRPASVVDVPPPLAVGDAFELSDGPGQSVARGSQGQV